MSRGGRGGGRGGRGGGRGGRAGPQLSWDNGEEPDGRPSDLFPPYKVPLPRHLKAPEQNGIQHFLLLRHQVHASGLYTSKRTLLLDPTAPKKMYGQEQRNALYGVKNKASMDPFTAMPTYSQRFVREERALPDWSRRPICRELFPEELLGTIDPDGGKATTELGSGPAKKKRKLELSSVSALPSAEIAFGMVDDEEGPWDGDGYEDHAAAAAGEEGGGPGEGRNALEKLEAMKDEEAEEGVDIDDEEGAEQEEEEDEAYDDEDAGDYDAENYFDGGDEMGDDYGDGDGDGEGTF